MANTIGGIEASGQAVEATMGAINEIAHTANIRIDTARNIAQRIHDLRQRLVGDNEFDANKECAPDAPTPVRAEVEELGHTMEVLRKILEETMNDLSQLERL